MDYIFEALYKLAPFKVLMTSHMQHSEAAGNKLWSRSYGLDSVES